MLCDKDFRNVCFSEYFKSPTSVNDQDLSPVYADMEKVLVNNGYQPRMLPYKDKTVIGGRLSIWCRDYMPIHYNHNNFWRFGYEPDYLRKYKTYRDHIPDAGWVVEQTGLEPPLDLSVDDPITSEPKILLDGGNVVSCGDKIIMTRKVFEENTYSLGKEKDFIDRLETQFSAHIVFLPWDRREIYGHTDGIARYLSGDRIIYNTYGLPEVNWKDKHYDRIYRKILEDEFQVLPMDFSDIDEDTDEKGKYCWAYVNWLQLHNLIIMPSFKTLPRCNERAYELIEKYTRRFRPKIEMVEASALVKRGGGFNCASWTF